MKRVLLGIFRVLRMLLAVLVIFMLIVNVYFLVRRYVFDDPAPTLFGFSSAVVISGSMEPEISIDDLIITRAQQQYAVGDVIMFRDGGTHITHRIIAVEEGRYLTQGSANNFADGYTSHEDVVGKVVAVWGGFGRAASFLQSPAGIFLLIAAVVIGWFVLDLFVGRGASRSRGTAVGSKGD